MKGLILGLGRFFTDLGAFIQLLIIIALALATGGLVTDSFNNGDVGLLCGILTFVILFVIFVFSNYVFYLFLDIHDSQVSIAKSLEKIAQNFTNNIDSSIDETIKQCPQCGMKYSANDNFCEKCGTKLD